MRKRGPSLALLDWKWNSGLTSSNSMSLTCSISLSPPPDSSSCLLRFRRRLGKDSFVWTGDCRAMANWDRVSLLINAVSTSDTWEEVSFLVCTWVEALWPWLWGGDEGEGEESTLPVVDSGMGIGRVGAKFSLNVDLELVSRNWCWERLPVPNDGLGEVGTVAGAETTDWASGLVVAVLKCCYLAGEIMEKAQWTRFTSLTDVSASSY